MKLYSGENVIQQTAKSAAFEPAGEHKWAVYITLERSTSSLGYCSDSFAQCSVQLPEPLSVHTTTAMIYSQSISQIDME